MIQWIQIIKINGLKSYQEFFQVTQYPLKFKSPEELNNLMQSILTIS
jgi:hypothetical protein